MSRGVVDLEGLNSPQTEALRRMAPPAGLPFRVAKELLRAREHLRRHDVKIDFDGRRRAGCQVAVEFRDPDNHFLELYWGLDQVGSDQRVRPPEEWAEEHSLEDAIRRAPPGQDTTLHGR